ncbi:MAG: 4-carboxy-4-hydroxy-2-oxoadipate aldolase/oxaloacetate decarboxylase [Deinococcales bacterium]
MNIEKFRELGVATTYEAAGRTGLIDCHLHQLLPQSKVAGVARAVACTQGDNLMVHACIEQIQPGEVVVLAMPASEPVGLIGDLLVTQIKLKGAAAILLNGAMRDVDELKTLGLPIWAEFIRARGATKDNIGALNVPVTMGGTVINPGDILVLDSDGATCVPLADAEAVLAKAEERQVREEKMRSRLLKGEISFDIHGLRCLVEAASRKGG